MNKINCWECLNCNQESQDNSVSGPEVCPASTEIRLDGVHGGKNGGRSCWVVASTQCDGEVQGTFSQKYAKCVKCDFYSAVRAEEGLKLEMSVVLLNKIRNNKIAH